MIKLKLFSESIELQASQIANQYPFVATITYGGKLSRGVVGGTENIPGGPYRVLIAGDLLRRKIKSLEGKSVLVSDNLVNHQRNYRVGTFLQAWVEAVDMPDGTTALAAKASGLLTETPDNKEIIEQIIDEARAEKLGFSWDIKDVGFYLKASTDSSTEQFVELTDFEWRGATILRRDAAAYEETKLAASKTTQRKDEDDMTPEQIREAMTPLISPLSTSIDSLKTDYASLKAEVQTLQASVASGTPKPPEKPQEPTSMTAKDFTDGLAAALTEANKPVIEGQNKILEALNKKEDDQTGVRRSKGPLEMFAAKYPDQIKDADDQSAWTAETYKNMTELVNTNQGMSKDEKLNLLATISSEKRRFLKSQMAGGAR